jgi:hypothetical protein
MSNSRDAVSRTKTMGKLSSKERNKLPSSDFAEPGERKYPINDKSHARNALSRAANKSPEVKAKVRAKVSKKFPGIGQKDAVPSKSRKRGAYRKHWSQKATGK